MPARKGTGAPRKAPGASAPAHDEVDAEILAEIPRPSIPVPARTAPVELTPALQRPARQRRVRRGATKAQGRTRAERAEGEDSAPAGEGEAELSGELDPAQAADSDVDSEAEALDSVGVGTDVSAIVPVSLDSKVARRDPLSAYMAEVTQHALLTREEETLLARRLRDSGDVKAAYRLVAANLRLVVKLAHEYHRNPIALLDLIQEGNIGLMQAVRKYDPERGVKLSSYAAWWIRAYILRYIMDNWKMVKVGTTEAQRKLFFKLRQEQEKLAAQGIEVTPKLLAERLNVTEQDVIEMDQRLGHDEVSLSAPVGAEDDSQTRGDRLASRTAVGADEALGSQQLKQLFREHLTKFASTLSEKERFLFDRRLMADEPLTLADVGATWGVSRERARQIEAALVQRMRTYMRQEIPDFDLQASEGD
jgi:RNA polymerase sigma-32 factor